MYCQIKFTNPSLSTLLNAFASRSPIAIGDNRFASIERLEHEDGSGYCYNVTGTTVDGSTKTVFVRMAH